VNPADAVARFVQDHPAWLAVLFGCVISALIWFSRDDTPRQVDAPDPSNVPGVHPCSGQCTQWGARDRERCFSSCSEDPDAFFGRMDACVTQCVMDPCLTVCRRKPGASDARCEVSCEMEVVRESMRMPGEPLSRDLERCALDCVAAPVAAPQ